MNCSDQRIASPGGGRPIGRLAVDLGKAFHLMEGRGEKCLPISPISGFLLRLVPGSHMSSLPVCLSELFTTLMTIKGSIMASSTTGPCRYSKALRRKEAYLWSVLPSGGVRMDWRYLPMSKRVPYSLLVALCSSVTSVPSWSTSVTGCSAAQQRRRDCA